jgi:hypothetical protein
LRSPFIFLLFVLLVVPIYFRAGDELKAPAADATVPAVLSPPTAAKPAPIHIVLDGTRKPGDCKAEGLAVQQELQTLPFPPGWTIAIMCTPVRWDVILREADIRNTHAAAFTRPKERITILNAAIFHDFPLNYRHIMAHELAHIRCGCADEAVAEKLAFELEKARQSP